MKLEQMLEQEQERQSHWDDEVELLEHEEDSGVQKFTMLEYSDRVFSVVGFDENLMVDDKKIGTGVAAFDKKDGTTLLVLVHESIDHTDHDHTILSTNQLRHCGVDICDIHPKFSTGGRQGLLRIKIGDHELPFKMENALATLKFRRPTEEELDNCDQVVQLTSPTL